MGGARLTQFKKAIGHDKKVIEANGIVNFNIPAYGIIDNIMLEFWNGDKIATRADAMKAIGQTELTVEQTRLIDVNLSDIDELRSSMGVKVQSASAAGIFELCIQKYCFDLVEVQKYFSIGTAIIPSGGANVIGAGIQLALHVNADITGVSHVKLYTVRRAGDKLFNSSAYLKFLQHPQNFDGTGEHKVQTLPRNQTDAYLGIIIDAKDGVIAGGEISVDSEKMIHKIGTKTNKYLQNLREFEQLDGQLLHMFADGSIAAGIPMAGVTDLDVTTEFSTAPASKNYRILSLTMGNYPVDMLKQMTA